MRVNRVLAGLFGISFLVLGSVLYAPLKEVLAAVPDQEGVVIDETTFPDESFRTYVKNNFDLNHDDSLSAEEINRVTNMLPEGLGITTVKGVEYFVNLTMFSCENNQLTELDLSQNTKLERVFCDNNNISSLNLGNNTNLELLRCEKNQLTSLDVSKYTNLRRLVCYNNNLTTLDVSSNAALSSCVTPENLEADVTNCISYKTTIGSDQYVLQYDLYSGLKTSNGTIPPALTVSVVEINEENFPDSAFRAFVLENYDLNHDEKLSPSESFRVTSMNVVDKNIASLVGLKHFIALSELKCDKNELSELDVSKNTALSTLSCKNNQLSKLDLSQNTHIRLLYAGSNCLTELKVPDNSNIEVLSCDSNRLTSLNLGTQPKLKALDCYENGISSLNLSGCSSLKTLDCHYNPLQELDLSGSSDLCGIISDDNRVQYENTYVLYRAQVGTTTCWLSFDLYTSVNTVNGVIEPEMAFYTPVEINDENFKDAAFRKYVEEEYDADGDKVISWRESVLVKNISVDSKEFTTMSGVEYFPLLSNLRCINSKLTSLNLSQNRKLESLDCSGNSITSLNISGCKELVKVKCYFNDIATLDIRGIDRLNEIVQLTNRSDDLASYVEYAIDYDHVIVDLNTEVITDTETIPRIYEFSSLEVNATTFPDENFRSYVLSAFDGNEDQILSVKELLYANRVYAVNLSISSLKGLELLPFVESLSCSENPLGELDLSEIKTLKSLYCNNCELTSLILPETSTLTYINCSTNELETLSLNGVNNVSKIFCSNNKLTELNLSNRSSITYLDCQSNNIENLNVTGCPNLKTLCCQNNKIEILNIGGCTYLTNMTLAGDQYMIPDGSLTVYSDPFSDCSLECDNSTKLHSLTTPPTNTPTPTKKPTPTNTVTPTKKPTPTNTVTPTKKPTVTPTKKPATPTPPKPTATPTKKVTPTPTKKVTPTPTKKVTPTPTKKATPTPTKKVTPTPTKKATPTPTKKVTPTPTKKVTPTPTKKATPTPIKKPTATPIKKPTATPTVKVSAPSNVKAKASSPSTVDISWTPATNTDFVQVWRTHKANAQQSDYVLLGTYYASDGKSVSKSLTPGKTYYYKLRSYKKLSNGSKVYSGYSAIVSATPKVDAPTGLKVTGTTKDSISLTWNKISGSNILYEVWRIESPTKTPGALLGIYTGTTKTSTNLKSGTTYYYRVRAYYYTKDANGQTHKYYSGYSTIVSAKTK
ncbi:MAG: hypothetical protein IKG93_03625 [Clostridiales bacterium]|nr:hypothetical protein [Clostridiales bacterium]